MPGRRLAALCLLLAAAVTPSSAAAFGEPDTNRSIQPTTISRPSLIQRQRMSTLPSSSQTTVSYAVSAAAPTSASANSYITLDLPDSFVQCQPAQISFKSVISARDEDLLGGTDAEVKENTWINVKVKDKYSGQLHLSQDLPSTSSSWNWSAVDLPAGTSFLLYVSSLTNISAPDTAVATVTSGRRVFTTTTTLKAPKQSSSNRGHPQILAQNIARSNVIAPTDGDASCLKSTSNGTADGSGDGSFPGGSRDGQGQDQSRRSSNTVVVVAAVLGGLCGLFLALVGALCWHKRKDQRRLRQLAQSSGSGYSHDIAMARRSQLSGGYVAAADGSHQSTVASHNRARSSAVPLWDGGYRDGPSAGWGYMSSLAPGLSPQAPPAFASPTSSPIEGAFAALRGRRRRSNAHNAAVNRQREEGEEDLPTYGKSEEELKKLPTYEPVSPSRSTNDDDAAAARRDEYLGMLTSVREESEDGSQHRRSGDRSVYHGFPAPPAAELGRSVTMSSLDRGSFVDNRASSHNGSIVFSGPDGEGNAGDDTTINRDQGRHLRSLLEASPTTNGSPDRPRRQREQDDRARQASQLAYASPFDDPR